MKIGDKVELLTDIYDDGEDHHPPGYLAYKGDVLIIHTIRAQSISVAHVEVEGNSFFVWLHEFKPTDKNPTKLKK